MDGRTPPSPAPRTWTERIARTLPLLLMLGLSLGLAGWAYVRFWPDARFLWWSPTHDRNSHYWMAQCVGLDLRNGDLVHLARDIERMRVWGPTFPLLTGLILAVGGPDYRLAALTSIAAWVGTALFAFLAARRTAPQGGNLAGCVAAVLVMASPAFHAFATDIMLEGSGACLSLAVVYGYLRARQTPSPGAFRWFALALTALFFLKSNYWLLALFALAMVELCRWFSALASLARSALQADHRAALAVVLRGWFLAQLRNPLTYLLIGEFACLAAYMATGPFDIPVGKHPLRVASADAFVELAYATLLLRLLIAWVRVGRPWLRRRSTWGIIFVEWHLWPAAVWFALPNRLTLFVEYMTRNHGVGEATGWNGRVAAYTHALAADYLPGAAGLALVIAFMMVALLGARRLRPGAGFLLWFIAVSAGLTLLQPTCRSRFLHSWIAATWAAAGVGLALTIYGWRSRPPGRLRHAAAGAALTSLILLAGPNALGPGRAAEGGPDPEHRCVLPIADELMPRLDGSRRVAILSNNSLRFFVSWTHQEYVRRTETVVGEVYQLPDDAAAFEPWAERNQCDAVAWIDVAPGSLLYFPSPGADGGHVPELMARQPRFAVTSRCVWPALGCSAVVWRRTASQAERGR
ncbi:MAG TPA: hypothetical protein VMS17_24365 [Gemmataceae bacterium]|nr:hypothetical protein [Gemmataceae bacterium]